MTRSATSRRVSGSMAATRAGLKKRATAARIGRCDGPALFASVGGSAKPTPDSTRNAFTLKAV